MDVDGIQQQLGGCGCYQVLTYLLLSLVYMRGAWHTFGSIFLGATPGHTCIDSNSSSSEGFSNLTKFGSCSIEVFWNDTSNETIKCHRWSYNTSVFTSTVVSQWDLVCDSSYLADLSTTIYMVGTMMGALILTPLSDRFGRKPLMLICLLLQAAVGSAVAFSPNYTVFTLLRCIVGFFNMGIALSAYVSMTEVFPASHRTLPSIGIQNFWASGVMLLSLFSYLIRDWRHLQLLISLPNVLVILYIWFLPESLPWLLSKKQWKKAKAVIAWAVKLNRLSVSPSGLIQDGNSPDSSAGLLSESKSPPRNQLKSDVNLTPGVQHPVPQSSPSTGHSHPDVRPLDLLRTPRIRLYSLIMWFLFFVNSVSYFGISFNTPNLHGDPFLNLFLMGLVEVPAYVICMIVINWTGRRLPVCIFLLICGTTSIANVFIPSVTGAGTNLAPLKLTLVMLGKFGITGSYSTIYLLAAEIFPTAVRNQAVGIASFFENIGSISAPLVVYAATHISELPLAVFGVLTLVGGGLILILPETKNRALPDTVEEIESWRN